MSHTYNLGDRVLYGDKPGRVTGSFITSAPGTTAPYYRVALDNGAVICPAWPDELRREPTVRVAALEAEVSRSRRALAAIARRALTLRRYPTDYSQVEAIISICNAAFVRTPGGSPKTSPVVKNSEASNGSA